ncbi:MAG TPA: alpha/beta fold hydrolase, partial [bacterium]|nr:alpha/beta fold hydrolase [bacterium]
MPLLTTDRGRFFCQEAGPGPGPALFLCHGLTSNHRAWERVEGPLAGAGFHLFAFDMRGHGASDRPGSGYAPEDHARDLEACARALGLGRVQAVGHSTGGRNALVFAALFPALVAGLAVVDQTLSADAESWRKYQKRYGEYPVPFADEGALDAFLREKFPDDARRFDYYKSQFWARPDGRWDFNFSI